MRGGCLLAVGARRARGSNKFSSHSQRKLFPFAKRAKTKRFFVRELVEDHILRVPYVATAENLADFFTKSLNPVQFIAIRNRIMNVRAPEDSTATSSSQ